MSDNEATEDISICTADVIPIIKRHRRLNFSHTSQLQGEISMHNTIDGIRATLRSWIVIFCCCCRRRCCSLSFAYFCMRNSLHCSTIFDRWLRHRHAEFAYFEYECVLRVRCSARHQNKQCCIEFHTLNWKTETKIYAWWKNMLRLSTHMQTNVQLRCWLPRKRSPAGFCPVTDFKSNTNW